MSDLGKLKRALSTRKKNKIELANLANIWVSRVRKGTILNSAKAEQTLRYYCGTENGIFRIFKASGVNRNPYTEKEEFIKIVA